MSTGLPTPETVPSEARAVAQTGDGPAIVLAGDPPDPETVELTDDGYAGADAGDLGRLAAAVEAATETDASLHYPNPAFEVAGPWLVLEPLSGFVSTVHRGTGTATVRGADTEQVRAAILDAAAPKHEHYPLEADEHGVFTLGMTGLDVAETSAENGEVTVSFDVSTTPATTAREIEGRFADIDGVRAMSYTSQVAVERADPSQHFRRAVEAAHVAVQGDAQYEWYPEPTVFSRIPSSEKIAVGIGDRGANEFDHTAYHGCVEILVGAVNGLEANG